MIFFITLHDTNLDRINQALSASVSISENTIEDVIISSHTSSNSIHVSYTLSNPVVPDI